MGDVETLTLFDPGEVQAAVYPPDASRTRRRTELARARIANGVHPLARLPLTTVEGATCGNCRWSAKVQHGARSYLKCLGVVGATRSEATDLRARWPGCTAWDARAAAAA